MEQEGPDGFDPIPALKAVNDQQPTAELRPADQKQTDEDDLMPYEVLDAAILIDNNWACGPSASLSSGAAISGSENDTLRRSI